MASRDTVDRILDAAEQLFAEHGYDGTSLRAITSEAGRPMRISVAIVCMGSLAR